MYSHRKGQVSAIEAVVIVAVIFLAVFLILRLFTGYLRIAGGEVNLSQLNTLAQSLLTYIVTNAGNPVNWGNNASGLSAFGLAEQGQPYSLDPFKILQLVYWDYANNISGILSPQYVEGYCNVSSINSVGLQQYLSSFNISSIAINGAWIIVPTSRSNWLISYSLIKQLLGLDDKYDFMLIIEPLFMINITPSWLITTAPSNYLVVKVTDAQTGKPASGVTVQATYFIADSNGDDLACQYGIKPCANVAFPTPPLSSFNIVSTSPLLVQGEYMATTNSSGVAVIYLPMVYDNDNYYYIVIYAESAGLGDYAYFQYPSQQVPLIMVGMFLQQTGGNVLFTDPHLLTTCLLNQGLIGNPGQSALGLRIIAVFRSVYGYIFQSINFTINPGRGSQSYPVPCTYLSSLTSNQYSACYINLPTQPMLLLVWVTRNSQGQGGSVPLSQLLVIPYGYFPDYLLYDRVIVFGRAVKYAPTATAETIAYVGNAAYLVKLYLYYRGNVYGGLGVG